MCCSAVSLAWSIPDWNCVTRTSSSVGRIARLARCRLRGSRLPIRKGAASSGVPTSAPDQRAPQPGRCQKRTQCWQRAEARQTLRQEAGPLGLSYRIGFSRLSPTYSKRMSHPAAPKRWGMFGSHVRFGSKAVTRLCPQSARSGHSPAWSRSAKREFNPLGSDDEHQAQSNREQHANPQKIQQGLRESRRTRLIMFVEIRGHAGARFHALALCLT